MKVLIISPSKPKTIGKFNKLLTIFSKKNTFPPKELLLISILLPITWDRKIIDMDTNKLGTKDIKWADYIFINANETQYNTAIKTIKKCNSLNKKIIACGSLFTEYFDEFENLEHLALDNIRTTLPQLINDLENKKQKKVYHSNPFFEIRKSSESYYSLANFSRRFLDSIQLAYD